MLPTSPDRPALGSCREPAGSEPPAPSSAGHAVMAQCCTICSCLVAQSRAGGAVLARATPRVVRVKSSKISARGHIQKKQPDAGPRFVAWRYDRGEVSVHVERTYWNGWPMRRGRFGLGKKTMASLRLAYVRCARTLWRLARSGHERLKSRCTTDDGLLTAPEIMQFRRLVVLSARDTAASRASVNRTPSG